MSASNAVERIDLKQADFCSNCAQAVPSSEL
jgi:predicted Zn-dependent protease